MLLFSLFSPEASRDGLLTKPQPSPLPRSHGSAEVTCQQVGVPIAFRELQVADDRLDGQPFLSRQFVPRQLQIRASSAGKCLHEKRRITSRHPAEGDSRFIDSLTNEFLRQLAGSQRAALVHLVGILAQSAPPPIGTLGKPIVSLGLRRWRILLPVQTLLNFRRKQKKRRRILGISILSPDNQVSDVMSGTTKELSASGQAFWPGTINCTELGRAMYAIVSQFYQATNSRARARGSWLSSVFRVVRAKLPPPAFSVHPSSILDPQPRMKDEED